MKNVRMHKDVLVGKIIANRETHIAEYQAAVEGYMREQVTEATRVLKALGVMSWRDDGAMTSAMPGAEGLSDEMAFKHNAVPQSHETEYDRALSMLHDEVATEVELDAEAYRQLVLDEWDWTHRFKSITATYGKGGVG